MAKSKVQKVMVDSREEMEAALTGYLAQGYVVANKTATRATLQKPKEFSVLWAVVGLLLCALPLLIYLIVYAMQPDVQIVEIIVDPSAETAE